MILLQALKELRTMAASGCVAHPGGICNQLFCMGVFDTFGKAMSCVVDASIDWQHNAGECFTAFPVPTDVNCNPWEGMNLNYRLSLINHMINKLEDL